MQHMTPLRHQIIEVLKSDHLLSAKEMLQVLEKNGNFVNKTTVYRALEYLESTSVLQKIQFIDMDALYETSDDPHDHLFCVSCRTIEKTRLVAEPMQRVGPFQVKQRQVTYYGLCKKCGRDPKKRSLTEMIGL